MSELKTLTYVVKVNVDDAEKKGKTFAVTLRTMEQDAKKAAVEVDKLAKTIGKKYGSSVKTEIDQTNSAANALRAKTKEVNKSERAFQALSREYTHLTAKTGKSAEEQEKMNALHRLGAKATDAQKKEVIRLVEAQQAQVIASNNTQKSFRGLRGQAQNLGWQFQDVAVQAQMGTDSLVIFGQQGSQLASGFGATGALIGAGIAIGAAALGVLSKSLKETKVDTKDLDENIKSLKASLNDLADGGFSGSMEFQTKTMKQVRIELGKLDINNAKVAKSMTESAIAYARFNEFNKAGFSDTNRFNDAMADGQFILAKNAAEMESLNKILSGATTENIKADKSIKDMTKALELQIKFLGEGDDAINNYKLSLEATDKAGLKELIRLQELLKTKKEEAKALKEITKKRQADTDALEDYIEKITNQYSAVGRSTKETNKHTASMITQDPIWQEQIESILNATDARKKEVAEIKEQIRWGNKFADIGVTNQNDNTSGFGEFMKTRATLLDESFARDIERAARIGKLLQLSEEDTQAKIIEITEDYAKTKASMDDRYKPEKKDKEVNDEKAFTKALEEQLSEQQKLRKDHMSALEKYSDTGKLIKLNIQYQQEKKLLAGNHEALINLEQHYADEKTKINGSVWEKMEVSARESLENTDAMMAESMDRLVSGTADAFGSAIVNADSFGDAMSNVFKGALSSMISFFAEWAIQKTLMWAFSEAGDSAAQLSSATTLTMNAQAASVMAGLNAFQSTAAIPYVGAMLAPAAAGAAVAATQPMAAAASSFAFAGVFDKGGAIPSGQKGIVAEYGDELVGGTMVYNGSQKSLNVTGREDTAKMMGGNTNNSVTVNSSGNASPDAIARSIARALKKSNKSVDNAIFDSMNRGRNNRGKKFA